MKTSRSTKTRPKGQPEQSGFCLATLARASRAVRPVSGNLLPAPPEAQGGSCQNDGAIRATVNVMDSKTYDSTWGICHFEEQGTSNYVGAGAADQV